MYRQLIKIIFTAAILLPLSAVAADTPVAAIPASPDSGFSFNLALMALLTLIAVLAMANALLANVVKQLALACRDQFRKERNSGKVIKSVLLALALIIPAIQAFAQEAVEAVAEAPVSPYISGIPRSDFYFLISILGFLFLVMLVLILIIRTLVNVLRNIPEKAHVPSLIFQKNFLDVFNKSVAVEKEEAIVLDHDYDGIRELDNDLPPWWKYGFILTIIVSVLYVGYYHYWGGPSQLDEYKTEVAKGEAEKAAYLAKSSGNVDENTVTMVLDAGELAAAENSFHATCGACHANDGGGTVGPNLTDDYWLHGGSLSDVFKSIKYGWPDKGMKSWKDDFSPKQIAALTSYVKTLKGTKPLVAKEPQGDLFVEGGDKSIDSVSNKTDPKLEPVDKKLNKDNPLGPYPLKKTK